jgi:hypothetical protein
LARRIDAWRIGLAACAQTKHHPITPKNQTGRTHGQIAQWSFKTAVELSAALAAKKVSAVADV